MNLSEIKKLIRLFEGSDIDELEVEQDGARVLMKKAQVTMQPQALPTAPVQTIHAQPVEPAPAPPRETETKPTDGGSITNSPMVGTFYRSPSPTTPSFVEVGDIVNPGQTLCIIEAMKLMNEIECEVAGKVTRIFPENGKPVEFGEPLFEIEPA
jgi:acetyl-CoA carboxylase biotin carboxyl carrier protein